MSTDQHCEIVSPEERNFRAKQALQMAILQGRISHVGSLCAPREPWRQRLLLEALPLAMRTGSIDLISTMLNLVDRSLDIHKVYRSALCVAAEDGSLEVLNYLLDQGEDPNQFFFGLSPLCCATVSNLCAHIELLVSRGARLDLCSDTGVDAFIYACCLNKVEAGLCLINLGALDGKDRDYVDRALASIDDCYHEAPKLLRQAVVDRAATMIARRTPHVAGIRDLPPRL